MYFVYILFSKKLKKKYIGFSADLRSRVKYHNLGKCPYTSRGVPWKLVYCEIFTSKKDAQEEERFLKTGKGRERLKYLLKHTLYNK